MLQWLVDQLGPWSWWIVGLVLLAAELVMPGMFLIWFGLGAMLTGLLSLALWGDFFWSWQVQALTFAVLSVFSIVLGRKLLKNEAAKSDEPLLNQRTASLVGRTATLEEPIRDGRGRIKLDDTWWPVQGPDLDGGTKVMVMSARGRDLMVDIA
ncbi:NfeD family protein [Rhizobium paknamense]|uniref:Membrane protein implicated in regulation of membrane protease activity n=1 Tax=Rhizobium paknamense TaxID=1206817 RepID=A0ABU0IK68_9HYPH|nr:NfeD family protein [Rhizobium paknamense]MDQ0458062.1 membrane protein implicated in regulation of membrane protease activity [Rhizobium paknamense]